MKNKKILSTLLGTALLTTVFTGCTPQKNMEIKESGIEQQVKVYKTPTVSSAEDAITLLKDGNTRFVNNQLANYDLSQTRRNELTEGQKPFAVVVTCSDSRVVPEHLFDLGLGDIFVIRVAGNILDKAEIGSIEYGVDHLGSPLVVILGHESCGAVTAAVAKAEKPAETHTTKNIDSFLDNIEPAVAKAKETKLGGKELIEKTVDLNVELATDQLLKDSSIVKKAVQAGKVKVVGAKYLLSNGEVKWLTSPK